MPPVHAEQEQLCLFPRGCDVSSLRLVKRDLQARAVPESTRAAYARDWAHFSSWCLEAGRDTLPSTAETLELYLVHCAASCGLKVATIQRRIAGVVWMHRETGHVSPVGDSVWSTMAAIARQLGREQRRARALTIDDMRRIAARCGSTAVGERNRALLLLGFSTGLRCASLVALRLADVRFVERGVVVTVRREKQDQEGYGRVIGVLRGAGDEFDCVAALEAWLSRRGRHAGPIFDLCSRSVQGIVKAAVAGIGLDAREYSSHSLRAGMITSLDAAGVSLPAIMQRSGHKSIEVAARYVRHREAFAHDPLASGW